MNDEEIISKLAETDYWEEGKIHPSIHRLYVDVVCPDECPSNEIHPVMGFCYCENCERFEEKGVEVCVSYKGAMHKFGGKGSV